MSGDGNPRRVRVAEAIRQGLAEMIDREVKDPRVREAGLVNVNHVELNSDMSIARVYVSFFGVDERRAENAMRGLDKAASFLRGPLGRKLGLARPPSLRFTRDHSPEFHERLAEIIAEDQVDADTGAPEAETDADTGAADAMRPRDGADDDR